MEDIKTRLGLDHLAHTHNALEDAKEQSIIFKRMTEFTPVPGEGKKLFGKVGRTFTLPIRLFPQVIAYVQTKIVKKGGNQNNTKNQQNANNNTRYLRL